MRVSFYVANKNCDKQKIVRVDQTTHKIGNFLTSSVDPSFQSFVFKKKIARVDRAYFKLQ